MVQSLNPAVHVESGVLGVTFRLYLDELEDTQVLSQLCVFEGEGEGGGVELGIDPKQDHSP